MNQRPGHTFDPRPFQNTDLLRYCTYLTPELAPQDLTAITEINPHLEAWYRRSCESEDCPARPSCPFHKSAAQTYEHGSVVVEELHSVIEAAVASRCLHDAPSKSLFVGRTMNAAEYAELLNQFGVPSNHSVRALLKKLATRGFVIGYKWGSSEGIHGWLDPYETRQLLSDLSQLPLPQYEPTLEAAQLLLHDSQVQAEAFRKDEGVEKRMAFHRKIGSSVQFGFYAAQDKQRLDALQRDWLALSLSFVRTMAVMAESQAMGILWGNDVSRWIFDVQDTFFSQSPSD